MKPGVAISMGDPLGIGPEVLALALADGAVRAALDAVVFGDRETLRRAAALRGVALEARMVQVGALSLQPSAGEAGAAALGYLDRAARAVVAREAKALCTAPLSKERVALSAPRFVGHTEHLAAQSGARVAMMLAGPRLRVVLATTHLALSEVPRQLTAERIAFVTRLAARELRERWAIAAPRIAVCGLNPHAGEHGLFGRGEEENIIVPAIEAARARGHTIEGPLPPDTAFIAPKRRMVDAYICLYHDQALIPLKALAFDTAVNTTLGLPVPRTSVDHGTACDIAWQGKANGRSLVEAVLLAAKMAS